MLNQIVKSIIALVLITSCGPAKISIVGPLEEELYYYQMDCNSKDIATNYCEQFYNYNVNSRALSEVHEFFSEIPSEKERGFYLTALNSDLIINAEIVDIKKLVNNEFEGRYIMQVNDVIAYSNKDLISTEVRIYTRKFKEEGISECRPREGENMYFLKKHDSANAKAGYWIQQAKFGKGKQKQIERTIKSIIWLNSKNGP